MQTALRRKTETGNEKDPSAALGMTKRGNASFHSFSTCCGSQPRLAALGSPFQGKGLAWTLPPSYGRRENAASQTSHEEGLRYENAAFPHCHFERKREIFFVRGQAKNVRGADSWKHRAPSESEGRCFMQTALRRKTETGNEKDPSAALGMTKRRNVSSHCFSFRCEPTSAPSGHLLAEEGGRMPASPIANPFPVSSSRNLPLFCGTI